MKGAAPRLACLLATLVPIVACSRDPFHLSYRVVSGTFVLHRWEDGKTYYLESADHEADGGGVLNGVVTQIGWNANYIVARRHAIFGGDPDGWMIVDVHQKSVRGPFDDRQINEMAETRGIKTLSPEQAFKDLQ